MVDAYCGADAACVYHEEWFALTGPEGRPCGFRPGSTAHASYTSGQTLQKEPGSIRYIRDPEST